MTRDADPLEDQMRRVLIRLALTTNGATARWDSSGGGEPDYTPRLGHSDAPHLHYTARWNEARDDGERRRVFDAAADELDSILKSRGDSTREESRASLHKRIVREGRGFPARDVAVRMRTGLTTVYTARRAAGVDLELGEPPRAAAAPAGGRRERLEQRMAEAGCSLRQAAVHLGISYSTALRDVGQKA